MNDYILPIYSQGIFLNSPTNQLQKCYVAITVSIGQKGELLNLQGPELFSKDLKYAQDHIFLSVDDGYLPLKGARPISSCL